MKEVHKEFDKILITEMCDPVFYLPQIYPIIKSGQPIILYSKGIVPIDIFEEHKNVGFNLTISGWGGSWLEPRVTEPEIMISYYNSLIAKIDINRIKLRIDPGIPTKEGLKKAIHILKSIDKIPQIIISIIQKYKWHSELFNKLGIEDFFYTIESGNALFPEKEIAESWIRRLLDARPEAEGYISFCGMPYEVQFSNHVGCVDETFLKAIGVEKFIKIKKGYQRPGCKCVIKKKQVLNGQQCLHGCMYCYAQKAMI